MAHPSVVINGVTYATCPEVDIPKSGGGTATFTDVTDTTAAASNVADTRYFYTSSGVRTKGTMPTRSDSDVSQESTIVMAPYGFYPDGIEYEVQGLINPSDTTATAADVASGKYFYTAAGVRTQGTASGGGTSVKTATGTFTGNGTRTIDVSCAFEPDIVYVTSNPGTTASSGTVALIIVRGMMTATRYRNNATTNSHYAIPDITAMNTGGSSYSWRATYANSKVTLYCFSNNARALLTNGRTYSYTFVKYTS